MSRYVIGPHQSGAASNLSPGLTFAGGPSFTVDTLDTKEFYSGILAPVDKKIVEYYQYVKIPSQVLYTLLFSEIDITRGSQRTVLNSTPTEQCEWNAFQYGLKSLIDSGLSVKIKNPDYYGPRIMSKELDNPNSLAALAKENIQLVPGKKKINGQPIYWHAVKDNPEPEFTLRSKPDYTLLPKLIANREPCPTEGRVRSTAARYPMQKLATRTLPYQVTVRVRSTEGIIYFLGEIIRSELRLDAVHPKPITPWLCFNNKKGHCKANDILFSMGLIRRPDSISTVYDGQMYSVHVDPSNRNHSAQVLEFVTQLLALSSSSKDLPSPGVFTLIGR